MSAGSPRADRWGAQLGLVAADLVDLPVEGALPARDLPSREALHEVVEQLRVALFAEQLGPSGLDVPGQRAFVRMTLERALGALAAEIAREPVGSRDGTEEVLAFAETLPEIRRLLHGDLAAAVAGDPAARSTTEILACYPGFRALLYHRIAHALHRLGPTLIARIISDLGRAATAIDIHPGAAIGERCFIDHGAGVVIGETAVLGAGVRLYQGVTLGARNFPVDAEGHIIRGAPRHPVLEEDVIVYASATILGRVTIGRGSVIGGGVWLTRSVPPRSHIMQAPLRADSFADGSGI